MKHAKEAPAALQGQCWPVCGTLTLTENIFPYRTPVALLPSKETAPRELFI